jgi:hypothetical protein
VGSADSELFGTFQDLPEWAGDPPRHQDICIAKYQDRLCRTEFTADDSKTCVWIVTKWVNGRGTHCRSILEILGLPVKCTHNVNVHPQKSPWRRFKVEGLSVAAYHDHGKPNIADRSREQNADFQIG